MKLTDQEFKHISKPPLYHGKDPTWLKAFGIYNSDHPNERPLEMNCVPCYVKVWRYLKSIRDDKYY